MSSVISRLHEQVRKAIEQAIIAGKLANEEEIPAFIIEVPKEKNHGDLATNVALQLTRIAKQNPRQIAACIVQHLCIADTGIERVEVAGPGFLNFYIHKRYLYDVIHEVNNKGSAYGSVSLGAGQRIAIEFVSANPTGNLHLGHARGAAVGDALCNLLEYAGYEVTREYYINDAGSQVNHLGKSIACRYKQALGQQADMPVDGYYGADIKHMAEQLIQEEGERLLSLAEPERTHYFCQYGLTKALAKIKHDLECFRVQFTVWFSEASLYEKNEVGRALDILRASDYLYEQSGATWLQTTTFGDDKDRVLVKNDRSYTYFMPDISYHMNKYTRGFDKLINIWGADHHGYIARIKAAMQIVGNDPDKLEVLTVQMVSLFQNGEKVKMSKRTGKAVTLEELIDEVGVDAIRYFFTMRSIDSQLDFDMDLAVSTSNENPVYYVQYAHARICSIYRQAKEQGIVFTFSNPLHLSKLTAEHEFALLHKMGELPAEITYAARDYAPHRLVRYVYEVAALFHSYYRAERIISADIEQTQARLALLGAVRTVIANVLRIIGVAAPEQM